MFDSCSQDASAANTSSQDEFKTDGDERTPRKQPDHLFSSSVDTLVYMLDKPHRMMSYSLPTRPSHSHSAWRTRTSVT